MPSGKAGVAALIVVRVTHVPVDSGVVLFSFHQYPDIGVVMLLDLTSLNSILST